MIYLANSIFQQKEQINDYYLFFFSLHLFQSIHCGLHRSVQHIYKLRLTNNTNNSTCLHFQPLQRPPDRPTDIPIRSPRRRKAPPISDSSSISQAQTHFFFHTIRPFSQTLLAHDLPNDEAQTHSMYISGRWHPPDDHLARFKRTYRLNIRRLQRLEIQTREREISSFQIRRPRRLAGVTLSFRLAC